MNPSAPEPAPAALATPSPACRICGQVRGNRLHQVREMMYGRRDAFTYLECAACGCLQLLTLPTDWSRYYPPDYYSFRPHGRLKTWLRHHWSAYALGRLDLLGWLLSRLAFPHDAMVALRHLGLSPADRMLDVGCGAGHLIADLWHLGFRQVSGLDPYVAQDNAPLNGPPVYKKTLGQMTGEFDLVMSHHSFEHMDAPADMFHHLARLLAPRGHVLLRLPVADSYAWRHYGVHWVNLDAPRHRFLHTRRSLDHLASQAGLRVQWVLQETNPFQFWGSEQYRRDIPLLDARSHTRYPWRSPFSRTELRRFQQQAVEVAARQESDCVAFLLTRAA